MVKCKECGKELLAPCEECAADAGVDNSCHKCCGEKGTEACYIRALICPKCSEVSIPNYPTDYVSRRLGRDYPTAGHCTTCGSF
jgi:hypothetical protein